MIKAGCEAAAIRARHPDAKFVVWLCTNRRLATDLQQPVYDKAVELGVEVRFLEQSSLRDFLDVKPEGQWLRQEHLGIQADQMSESLLRHLSRESLSRYANDLLLPPPDQIVPTRAAQTATEAVRGTTSLHLLVGPSGAGKSVIAHDLLCRHLDAGGTGLWIPGEVAEAKASLADTVEVVLRSLHPRAGFGVGHDALRMGNASQPLMLVLDDANRSPDPVRLLRRVIGWSRPGNATEGAAGIAKRPVRIVCPAWAAYWYPLMHTYESDELESGVPGSRTYDAARGGGSLPCEVGASGDQGGGCTDAELAEFAERLHDDPILP